MSSDIVRQVNDFGKDLGLVHEAVVTGRKVGAEHSFWSLLAHSEQMFRRIVDFTNFVSGIRISPRTFQVTVDYGKSTRQMIDDGTYAMVSTDSLVRFPTQREAINQDEKCRTVNIHLISLKDRDMPLTEFLAQMGMLGYRPANLYEMLALGSQHPQVTSLEFAAYVQVGTIFQCPSNGFNREAYLTGRIGNLQARTGPIGFEILEDTNCCFLAVPFIE